MLGCPDCQNAIRELCSIRDALSDNHLTELSKLIAVGLIVDSTLAYLTGIPATDQKAIEWAKQIIAERRKEK
jgi:hypothetical protein